MTMLIRGGYIRPMTARGDLTGDILIHGGRIVTIAETISPPADEGCCCVDAHGLTVLPGLIDAHVCDVPRPGVTAGLRWPDGEGACTLFTAETELFSRFYAILPEHYADARLHARMLDLAYEGFVPVCEVHGESACRRMLGMIHSTGVRAMLAGLRGCGALAEALVLARVPLVPDRDADLLSRLDASGAEYAPSDAFTADTPAATLTTAFLLGLTDRGFLAPGAAADIVLCDDAFKPVLTIAAGKIRH